MSHSHLDLEYSNINQNFRALADIRFKLLALVPSLGGAGVFLLSHFSMGTGKAAGASIPELAIVLLVGLLGFFATLGITLYDQRNSELYNALIHRARWLEEEFNASPAPGGLKRAPRGGQFNERPGKGRRIIFKAGHDLALALIYGPTLGAWLFPISFSSVRLAGMANNDAQILAASLAVASGIAFTVWLIVLDKREMARYHQAAAESLSEPSTPKS